MSDEASEADENQPDDADAGSCPVCGTEDCDRHLLASFDRSGEGEFGIGLCGGALYEVAAIGEVLDLTCLAWAQSARVSQTAQSPKWMTQFPPLQRFWECLGEAGFDPQEYDNDEDAAFDLPGYSDDYVSMGRWFLEDILQDCGWSGVRTEYQHDVPMMSTTFEYWWHSNPEDVAACLKAKLAAMALAARSSAGG
jgi:hypothetical protein